MVVGMKKIVLASVFVAAALFTACGEDSSSTAPAVKKYSCDINIDAGIIAVRTCVEAEDQAKINTVCDGVNALFADAGKAGSECSGKSVKKCDAEKDGVSFTAYFYDDTFAEESCDDLVDQATAFGF